MSRLVNRPGELIASENDPADTATVASRLSHSSSVADYQRQSSSVADYQEVFKQMKIEDPHSSMGALHQKSLVRLAELKAQREQYEQLLIEEQRQKQLEEWQSKRYVDRFVDTITGNGSVAGGSTNGLLDLSYRSALKTSTSTAPTVPRSDQSILSNDFLMTYTDNIPEEASTRRPILVSNRKDSIFSIGRRSSVASSKASNGSRRASVASSYTRRSSVASSKASSSRRTLRSSAQSSDAPEMNFALRSSVTGMKKPGSGDIADHLSVLSFESNHKPGDFAANEMDGLDCLTVHSKADTRSSSAVSKGGTRKPRLKKRPTNEDEAPVLDEDVANKVFTRPRKKRATIEDKPPILNQVVDVPRDRHQYRQNRRASDASELTTDSFGSHGSGSDSLIVGFVDRSEPPKGSCSRSKVQSVNDDDDEELIVGFVDRSHRSGTSNDDLRR